METLVKKKVVVKFIYDKEVKKLFPFREGDFSIKECKPDIKFNDAELLEVAEEEVDQNLCTTAKPSALFEDGDVTGQKIFGFQTPKRGKPLETIANGEKNSVTPQIKNSATLRTKNSVTPQTKNSVTPQTKNSATPRTKNSVTPQTKNSVTPRTKNSVTPQIKNSATPQTKNSVTSEAKTPYNLRQSLKRKIVAAVTEDLSDISASDSEWESEDEDESSSSSSSSSSEDDEFLNRKNRKDSSHTKKTTVILQNDLKSSIQIDQQAGSLSTSSRRRKQMQNYTLLPEGYFLSHASSKVRTSNRTLNCLRTPRLLQEQLDQILAKEKPPHLEALQKLQQCYQSFFAKWIFALEEGFNILLYGVGSKRKLLNLFRLKFSDPTVVVNGFFPSLTIQEIIDTITKDVLALKSRSADLFEAVDVIKSLYSSNSVNKLYLFIHNIDGPMLRNTESQEILASLASAHNIHIVASVDHINAPLMWDQTLLSQFNFLWWDTTTLQPYTDETAFESSLLVQRSGGLALSSLQNVFRSLTSNAKSIFLLMAQYQLSHKDSSSFSGMPFRDLYSSCRDSLLVSSDLALRSQLTEFLDHRLVRTRRGADGSELLHIPINADILSQFVEQNQQEGL